MLYQFMKERDHSNMTFVIIAIDTFGRVFLLIGFPLSGGGAAAATADTTSWLCRRCAASSFCGPHLATGCFFERQ